MRRDAAGRTQEQRDDDLYQMWAAGWVSLTHRGLLSHRCTPGCGVSRLDPGTDPPGTNSTRNANPAMREVAHIGWSVVIPASGSPPQPDPRVTQGSLCQKSRSANYRNHGGDIVDRAAKVERLIITRSGKPVAELRPTHNPLLEVMPIPEGLELMCGSVGEQGDPVFIGRRRCF